MRWTERSEKCQSGWLIYYMSHVTHVLDSFKLNEDLVMCTHPLVTVVMDTLSFKFIVVHTADIWHDWLRHTGSHEFLLSARLSSSIKVIHVGLIMLIILTVSSVFTQHTQTTVIVKLWRIKKHHKNISYNWQLWQYYSGHTRKRLAMFFFFFHGEFWQNHQRSTLIVLATWGQWKKL